MRTPAGPEPPSRPQIDALEGLVAAGALNRGRRHRSRSARPVPPENPAPAARQSLNLRLAPNGVELLQVPGWDDFDWLWHGFTTRSGGVSRAYAPTTPHGELNLGFTSEDDRDAVSRNRQLLAEAVTGTPAAPLVTVRQIHSNLVLLAGPTKSAEKLMALKERDFSGAVKGAKSLRPLGPEGRFSPNEPNIHTISAASSALAKADGLITSQPGLLLAIMTADCIPVLVADRRRRVVAAFHAGWRGTVKRIVECGVGRMRLHFGSRPGDLVAAIGPGIGSCCYAVGEEVQAALESQFAYARDLFAEVYDPDPVRLKYPMLFLNQRAPGHAPPMMSLRLDLAEANRRQLIDAGLKPQSICSAGACTSCHTDRFFSHRAEHGRAGRMMAVIGIRNNSNR